jgi:ER lumen protein retaining receptor
VGALVYLAAPCLVLAVLFHPGLNSHFLADTTWAFSMYLESVAMMPQLFMFQKQVRHTVTHTTDAGRAGVKGRGLELF